VRFPGKKDGIIVLATHYETNYPLRDINFVGANDGAATTALLIEIGTTCGHIPPRVLCVAGLDDGEEAVESWSNSDSLYARATSLRNGQQRHACQRSKPSWSRHVVADKD